MFSCTMMAASSTKPTAKARPASEITFKLRSKIFNVKNATNKETGIVAAITNVAFKPLKNSHKIKHDSKTPRPKLLLTNDKALRICTEASKLNSIAKPFSASGPSFSSLMARLMSSSRATVLASLAREIRM